MQARRRRPGQTHGSPPPLARDLELHLATDRLRHAVGPAERLHPQRLARGLPLLEAGLERVGGGGFCGVGGGIVGVRPDAGAEGVVEARGRGGAFGLFGDVREGGGVGVRGDDSEGLCFC